MNSSKPESDASSVKISESEEEEENQPKQLLEPKNSKGKKKNAKKNVCFQTELPNSSSSSSSSINVSKQNIKEQEFGLNLSYSKEELTQLLETFLNKKGLKACDLRETLKKGASRSGFQFIKATTIEKFVDILLSEIQIEDDWHGDPKRKQRRFQLQRVFKAMFILQKLYLGTKKGKRARSTAILPNVSSNKTSEVLKLKRPENLKRSMRNYSIFFGFLCAVVFAIGWIFQRFASPKNYAYIGVGIGIAKGSAFALLVTTILCLFLMHRDLLSFLRRTSFGILYEMVLNENILFHRICGAATFFFGVLHTLGHLFGTFRVFSSETKVEKINAILLNNKFDRVLTYGELLFETIPGLTGVLLLLIMLLMGITSTKFYRKRHFQLFSYTHLLYIPFIILYYLHGCGFWFNYGWPLSLPFLTIPFIISIALHIKKLRQKTLRTEIIDVSFSAKNTVAFIKIRKPEEFNIIPGHYVFLNCPELSNFQWHPFSVCSTGRDGTLKLMIKKAGDFTKLFLALLFTAKSEFILASRPELTDHGFYQKLYYEFNLKEEELLETLIDEKLFSSNVPKYPRISLYGPITGPSMGALHQKNVVFVAAGVGLTPYLVYLEEYIYMLKSRKIQRRFQERDNAAVRIKKKVQELVGEREFMRKISVTAAVGRTLAEKKYLGENQEEKPLGLVEEFFNRFEKISFYYVARDSDQLSWLSSYIKRLIKYDYNAERLDLKLYLTTPKDLGSLDSFLFWRAFNKLNKLTKTAFSTGDALTNLPMQIIFDRPDFRSLFEARAEETGQKTVAVFACGPGKLLSEVGIACEHVNTNRKANFIYHPEKF